MDRERCFLLENLKVFRCNAFVHVPKKQRSKLDSKSTPCIFVGYGDVEFGYKLWGPKEKKMIKSQDVVFHENENLADFEKTKKLKATIEGVPNLTPTSSSLDNATNREEVQDENYGDEPIEFDADERVGVNGNDVTNTYGVEQGEQPPPLEMIEPQVRRSTRERHPSTRYPTFEYTMITEDRQKVFRKYNLIRISKAG